MKARTERHQQTGLDPLSGMISNFLGPVNSGTITIDIGKQPLLKLVIGGSVDGDDFWWDKKPFIGQIH